MYSPDYPQENGQVEVVNVFLKIVLQWIVSRSKNNWHTILYPTLWAWQNSVKTTSRFTTFQPVHGVEDILPIECEIPSLKLVIEHLLNTS